MTNKADIGVIGLGVMGANLARNLARNHRVSVYNRTAEKTEAFLTKYSEENLTGETSLEAFVGALQTPRKIILMVKAGGTVDTVIEQLTPLLTQEDLIIDCGNSLYTDTIRREQALAQQGVYFFGCGVSGGEEGALKGPSLMPGGSETVWQELQPLFESIAAKDFQGGPCVTYIGENGAGHFVKMVHNGIEYAVMQMMTEAYELLRESYKLSPPEISDIFKRFHEGALESYLFEIAIPIFRKKDELSEGFLIDAILDTAGQKGTGRWTALEGLQQTTVLSMITEAVFARVASAQRSDRQQISTLYKTVPALPKTDLDHFLPHLEKALYAGMLIAYDQGFELINTAAKTYNWKLNLSEIARIWQGGCIIRARLLETLTKAFQKNPTTRLLGIDTIAEVMNEALPSLRTVVSQAAEQGIPLWSLGSGLSSFEALRSKRTASNLLQALRDFFGAHTYERIDREGHFHTEWEK